METTKKKTGKKPRTQHTTAQQGKGAKRSAPHSPNQSKGKATPKSSAKKTTKRSSTPNKKPHTKRPIDGKLKIIPLGGLDEIGKNMTVLEYKDDIIVIDGGLAFPDEGMPGVDLVIPDITYLKNNRQKVKGIFITHGHEDHIGALPYVLKELNVPVYGTRLTMGLIKRKLTEHHMEKQAILMEQQYGDIVSRGCFDIEFIKVNHSIADACGFAIHTPVGIIVMTGDFKIDTTPIRGKMIDLTRFGELGRQGVLLMMSDSTNAERPGFTMSEKKVGKTFDAAFAQAGDRRIIIATFSSNIHRVQQIINAASKCGRKVALSGRSMENVMQVAIELGHMTIPKNTIIPLHEISKYPGEKVCLITTGSQGEPMSALYRMAFSDHKTVEITENDLIIISASPIPGNEKLVSRVINELEKLGATVLHDAAEVHVSGHACQEELKLMLGLVRPKYFMPVHGEFKHQLMHAKLAQEVGIPAQNIIMSEIGKVLEIDPYSAAWNGTVPSGKILVDGSGVGDVGNIVLRDRKHLAEDGIIIVVATLDSRQKTIVAGPDIISRGFVYVKENGELVEQARAVVQQVLDRQIKRGVSDWGTLKNDVRDELSRFISGKTKRHPMILPIIMDI